MTQNQPEVGLYGLSNSNRNFTKKESWGKNQFNSSFPAALGCYMHHLGIQPVYLKLDRELKVAHTKISVRDVFGAEPLSENLFFFFECDFAPYRELVVGKLPGVDLVTQSSASRDSCLKAIEIKLTALPDNSTCKLTDDGYGCEIVVRPDTIVYLALSIADKFKERKNDLLNYLDPVFSQIQDLTSISSVFPHILEIVDCMDSFFLRHLDIQSPIVMQPIWKTAGKSVKLYNHCLDMFIWSDFAFTRLFFDVKKNFAKKNEVINRQMRTVVWLAKMLHDFAQNGKMNHRVIIDTLTYDTKNDKAFSLTGRSTRAYMNSQELLSPRITKDKIRDIIIGGGHNFLSPERRFDGIILGNPEIFDESLKNI